MRAGRVGDTYAGHGRPGPPLGRVQNIATFACRGCGRGGVGDRYAGHGRPGPPRGRVQNIARYALRRRGRAGPMTGRVDRLHGDLVTLLAAYRDADAGQCAVREAMLAYLAARPDALRRSCAPGHFTASTLVVDPTREAVLLTLHLRWFHRDRLPDPVGADVPEQVRRAFARLAGDPVG